MAAEFVEPIRYTHDEPQTEAAPRMQVGVRRWLTVALLFVGSWYMHSINAVGYSVLLFVAAFVLLLLVTIYTLTTRPRASAQQRKRNDLLDRWSA